MTGMEPWFSFWEAVRFAIQEFRKQIEMSRRYNADIIDGLIIRR